MTFPTQQQLIELAATGEKGVSVSHHFCHNTGVGAAYETIWFEGGLYPWKTSATTLTISSDDANDADGGTGARTVFFKGLDGEYRRQEEFILMKGLTPVSTVHQYLRVDESWNVDVGSGGVNAGNIYSGTGTVTSGKPAVALSNMKAGLGSTSLGLETIPVGFTGYLVEYEILSSIAKQVTVEVFQRNLGKGFVAFDSPSFAGVGKISRRFVPYHPLPEKSDFEIRALAVGAGGDVSANFTIIYVPHGISV